MVGTAFVDIKLTYNGSRSDQEKFWIHWQKGYNKPIQLHSFHIPF